MHPANIAVLLSGHGYGHLTRTANILEALCRLRSVSLHVITSAPTALWPEALRVSTGSWLSEPCDAGIVQTDDLSVDAFGTRSAIAAWEDGASARLARAIETLGRREVGLVVGDVPALAFEVAEALGVRSVAVANFSWDWIYDEMGMPIAAERARRAYRKADLLLELTPAAPMSAFGQRRCIGTVGRDSSARRQPTRTVLGVAPTAKLALLAFRNPVLSRIVLPRPSEHWRFIAPESFPAPRTDTMVIPPGVEFADVLAASDVVVAKTGYGILADCVSTGARLLWVSRAGFPEDRVLEAWLAKQPWAHRVDRAALDDGTWGAALAAAAAVPASMPLGDQAVWRAAQALAAALS